MIGLCAASKEVSSMLKKSFALFEWRNWLIILPIQLGGLNSHLKLAVNDQCLTRVVGKDQVQLLASYGTLFRVDNIHVDHVLW